MCAVYIQDDNRRLTGITLCLLVPCNPENSCVGWVEAQNQTYRDTQIILVGFYLRAAPSRWGDLCLPRPLRTVRAGFPTHGSSPYKITFYCNPADKLLVYSAQVLLDTLLI